MERIQAAIAKARAAREQLGPQGEAVLVAEPAPAPVRPVAAPPVPDPAPPPDAGPDAAQPDAAQPAKDTLAIDAAWERIPEMKLRPRLLARHRVVAVSGGSGAVEVDGIRTRLLHFLATRGWRRVAITSPGPGCGKTMLAVNLGFSLARQRDQRALVFELDLRRPAMARTLGVTNRQEIARVLEGDGFLADHALRHGRNLAFATSQGRVRHPAELLQAGRTGEALDRIQADYQPTVMLFDLPPMLANDDAMAFMGKVDCVLLVAAAETTTAKELDRCERELASRTNVLGVVLNCCRYMERSESYARYGYE